MSRARKNITGEALKDNQPPDGDIDPRGPGVSGKKSGGRKNRRRLRERKKDNNQFHHPLHSPLPTPISLLNYSEAKAPNVSE
jgi:hypothetical protein